MDLAFGLAIRPVKTENDEFHSVIGSLSLNGCTIKGTSIFISTGGFMPPTNFALAKFPAQVYDAVRELIGEVAQP